MIIMRFEKVKSLKSLTTLGIGGKAADFVEVKNEREMEKLFRENKRRWRVIGSGSNIVAPDPGFQGLVIKIGIKAFGVKGKTVYAGAGSNLLDFIKKINRHGFRGMEKMAGIPGTVAGAIYGNAGAYGQEIKDSVSRVKIFDSEEFKWIKKGDCEFGYRTSVFKEKKDWIIVGAEFHLATGSPSVKN